MLRKHISTAKLIVLVLSVILIPLGQISRANITTIGDVTPAYNGLNFWEITDPLIVGSVGDGTVSILNDPSGPYGVLVHNDIFLSFQENVNGAVTVSGAGSGLASDESLYVGYKGNGILDVTDGGQISADESWIGVFPDVSGTASISGANSTWMNTSNLLVGAWGQGNLIISDGAEVTAPEVFISGMPSEWIGEDAQYPNAIPNGQGTVSVTGENSRLNVTAPTTLNVGGWGEGILSISNGGTVTSENSVIGGYDPFYNNLDSYAQYFDPGTDLGGGNGIVTVTGDPSLFQSQYLTVGFSGNGTLDISDGAEVQTDSTWMGFMPDSIGIASVSGVNSLWTNAGEMGDLAVGIWGQGNLMIQGGALVTSEEVYIGGVSFDLLEIPYDENFITNGTGTVTVRGDGSTLNVTGDNTLYVGYFGQGILAVNEGGGVNATVGAVGFERGSTGVVTVDGNGSFWQLNDVGEANGTLGVGIDGDGQLTISNGGRVTTTDAMVGGSNVSDLDPQDYPTGDVLVTGDNSLLQVIENLHIGGAGPDNIGPGSIIVSNGGLVDVGNELFVWDSGLLGGDSTVNVAAATTLLNSGTIAPGNSIGTLTVNGNVVFQPNSTYAVEISNDDTSDKLDVNGDVTINGGTVEVSAVDTIIGEHEYEIINANAVTGTFDVLNTALVQSVRVAGLQYDPDSVWLRIAAVAFNDPSIWRTENQRNVGETLQFIATNQGGNNNTAALQGLANFNQVRAAFDDLSGQTRPTLGPITTSLTSNYIGAVSAGLQRGSFGRSNRLGNGPLLAMAGSDPMMGMDTTTDVSPSGQTVALGDGTSILGDAPLGIWFKSYGLFGDRDSESGVFGYRYTTYGFGVGVDRYVTEELLLGITSGYSSGQIDYYDSRNNTDTDGIYFGLYGRWEPGDWYTQAMLTYAGMEYETDRYITLTGEHLEGDLDGYDIAGYIETGTSWEHPTGWKINPLVAAQWSSLSLDSYSESGGPSALTFGSERFNSIKSALGARISKNISNDASRKTILELRGRWVHEFDDIQASVDAAFNTNPGVLFKVSDSELSRDSAILGTGLKTELFENTSLSLEYDVRLNVDDVAHLVSIVFDHRR